MSKRLDGAHQPMAVDQPIARTVEQVYTDQLSLLARDAGFSTSFTQPVFHCKSL